MNPGPGPAGSINCFCRSGRPLHRLSSLLSCRWCLRHVALVWVFHLHQDELALLVFILKQGKARRISVVSRSVGRFLSLHLPPLCWLSVCTEACWSASGIWRQIISLRMNYCDMVSMLLFGHWHTHAQPMTVCWGKYERAHAHTQIHRNVILSEVLWGRKQTFWGLTLTQCLKILQGTFGFCWYRWPLWTKAVGFTRDGSILFPLRTSMRPSNR